MGSMELPLFVIYLSAGAYIAIMLAVLGVPQLLSSYFDLRARRIERAENEANTERRHQERLLEERRREERQEELRREERQEELRREERQEELRREERQEELRREERQEELRRQDAEASERRHQELMTTLIAALSNGRNQDNGQSELIRSLQQTIETLETENARLRQENGDGNTAHTP